MLLARVSQELQPLPLLAQSTQASPQLNNHTWFLLILHETIYLATDMRPTGSMIYHREPSQISSGFVTSMIHSSVLSTQLWISEHSEQNIVQPIISPNWLQIPSCPLITQNPEPVDSTNTNSSEESLPSWEEDIIHLKFLHHQPSLSFAR